MNPLVPPELGARGRFGRQSITSQTSSQQALESVDSWSLAEQKLLLDRLQNRIQQQQSYQILQEVEAVRQEVAEGKVRYGSVAEFLSELDN